MSFKKDKDFGTSKTIKQKIPEVDLKSIKPDILKNPSIMNAEYIEITVGDIKHKVLEVHSEHALTQAIGYVKYVYKDEFNILYRGQRRLYNSLRPTLYRNIRSQSAVEKRNEKMNDYIKSLNSRGLVDKCVPEYAREPLLQHYGINTRWIDLVDNHWVALWFAAHKFYTTSDGCNVHFERRVVDGRDSNNFAYLILVAAPRYWMTMDTPGLYKDSDAELIDLRVACPSFYVRPHAQHGYLLKRKSIKDENDADLSNRIAGIIRLPLDLANKLIGVGGLISGSSLFPPPYYDSGYARMLENRDKPDNFLGTITNIYPCI